MSFARISPTPSTDSSSGSVAARISSSPRLPKLVVQNIVREFRGLDEILAATDPELESVEGVGEIRAKDIREGLRRLQEINLVDRYLQT